MTPPDFPAGEYVSEPSPSPQRRDELIAEIDRLPRRISKLVGTRSPEQLERRYKKWTIRQIVHHLADSHMNAFVRFRLTLTEDRPTIKPYDETRWAELIDTRTSDANLSVALLMSLHARWVFLMRQMTESDWERSYVHPEYQKEFRLAEALGLYAHHCRHHSGQIEWLLP